MHAFEGEHYIVARQRSPTARSFGGALPHTHQTRTPHTHDTSLPITRLASPRLVSTVLDTAPTLLRSCLQPHLPPPASFPRSWVALCACAALPVLVRERVH